MSKLLTGLGIVLFGVLWVRFYVSKDMDLVTYRVSFTSRVFIYVYSELSPIPQGHDNRHR